MSAAPVKAGKQTGHVLCFLRSRMLCVEIVDGASVALFPYDRPPDHIVSRGSRIDACDIAQLRERYVICRNGAFGRHIDAHGGSYLAVPLASLRKEGK